MFREGSRPPFDDATLFNSFGSDLINVLHFSVSLNRMIGVGLSMASFWDLSSSEMDALFTSELEHRGILAKPIWSLDGFEWFLLCLDGVEDVFDFGENKLCSPLDCHVCTGAAKFAARRTNCNKQCRRKIWPIDESPRQQQAAH